MQKLKLKILDTVLKKFMRDQFYPGVDFPALRKKIEKGDALAARMDKGFTREKFAFNTFSGEWIKTPNASPERVLLYFHGGGFCVRTPIMHGQFLANICEGTDSTGLMPDYRLAPEHVFPAAFEDCIESYLWLLEKGYSPKNIIVGGDSAGGALALALLLHLRKENSPMPACAVLISAGIGQSANRTSLKENAKTDSVLSPEAIQAFSEAYTPGELRNDPRLDLLNFDYDGLPPLLIQAGSHEILLDDSKLLAKKAKEAGVVVDFQVYENMPHVFQLFSFLPEAKEARKNIHSFVRQYLD